MIINLPSQGGRAQGKRSINLNRLQNEQKKCLVPFWNMNQSSQKRLHHQLLIIIEIRDMCHVLVGKKKPKQ